MTLLNNIERLNPRAAAEITACLQPVRVGARTIRAMRRAWTVHDVAAIDLILQEIGWRLVTIDENIGRVDANVEPLFQVVPISVAPGGATIPLEEGDGGFLPCETCGHFSSQLVEGMCPGCRDRFNLGGEEQSDG